MAWTIKLTTSAEKELDKLDRAEARRILKYLEKRVTPDPRSLGEQLQGTLSEFWRYRVGDYRVLCLLEDQEVRVVVVKIGHRREVYRKK
jgi:mRNA interferase RelE/StbE